MKIENIFFEEVKSNIKSIGSDGDLLKKSLDWHNHSSKHKYSYNFSFLGRPIIQYPQDMIAVQELIWKINPDLIIETGIAHGGSLIMSASMLTLLDFADAVSAGNSLDPISSHRKVIGIDIDIREHNRRAIEEHPLSSKIHLIEGSSIDIKIIDQVKTLAKKHERILVCLDSSHTHDHVLAELEAYAPLCSIESYCIVFDTIIENMPEGSFPNRPWGLGNNPKTAVWEFLKKHSEFQIDSDLHNKLQITVAPDGYLKRMY
jgi:cephalosporin hydroxylase